MYSNDAVLKTVARAEAAKIRVAAFQPELKMDGSVYVLIVKATQADAANIVRELEAI